jgi:pyruvate dehydrogenase E2 component (dihydrolipoamide acetyltransferase)
MSIEIVVPRLGWSMDEGTFSEWLKKDGEVVQAGDLLFVLEGDKASQEIESFDAGILHIPASAPQPGETVVVGQRLGYLLAEGESPPSSPTLETRTLATPTSAASSISPPTSSKGQSQPSSSVVTNRPRVVASPRARRTARELGVDWASLPGSGRNGRVRECDVLTAVRTVPVAKPRARLPDTPGSLHPASPIRRTIAQRMLASVQQTAAVTLTTKVNAFELAAARQRYQSRELEVLPSYNDMLLMLVAASLPECPQLNACWVNGAVYAFDEINIAIAVDTPRGLLAPVLRNASALSLEEIAMQTRRLSEQAQSGKLAGDQLAGGTFTITNLGMFDVDYFTPIINLPQTAVLGLGRIVDEPIVAENQVVPGKTISLSLTFDHRVIDGAPAARWLQGLAKRIQQRL